MSNKDEGLNHKYNVSRTDGKPIKGGCITLEFDDPNSWPALLAWAETVRRDGYEKLADDVHRCVARSQAKIKNSTENWESRKLGADQKFAKAVSSEDDTALDDALSTKEQTMEHKEGDLQVWWIPQVPMKPFTVEVDTVEEGAKILEVLAHYDLFQFEHNVKPDYSNAGGLRVWRNGEWEDWIDEETGEDDPIEWLHNEGE